KQRRIRLAFQYRRQLPAKIVDILDTRIQPEPGCGHMAMSRVPYEENSAILKAFCNHALRNPLAHSAVFRQTMYPRVQVRNLQDGTQCWYDLLIRKAVGVVESVGEIESPFLRVLTPVRAHRYEPSPLELSFEINDVCYQRIARDIFRKVYRHVDRAQCR